MKINELRIGNYISPLGIGITVVEGLCTWDGLIQSSNFAERGIEDFEPIPLTEEWLLKFGFEDVDLNMSGSNWLVKEQKGLWRQAIRIAYSEKSEEWSLTLECVSPPTLSIVRLKYVHQLQNLYFALTGNELNIKSEDE
jgi:hypothetical protein